MTKHFAVFLITLFLGGYAQAAEYYASPSGTGSGLSADTPFQISDFWSVASPGDTLYLMDGTYNDEDSMINPPANVNGTSGNPIIIQALNDGEAVIDGSTTGIPVYLNQNDHITLRGFNAHTAGAANQGRVIWSRDSDNVIMQRIVAWDGDPTENGKTFMVDDSDDVLIEDCAGWGPARKIFEAFESNDVTFRRCFARWTAQNDQNPYCMAISLSYNSTNTIVENCIATWDEDGYTVDDPELIKNGLFGVDGTSADGGYSMMGCIGYYLSTQVGPPKNLYNLGARNANTNYTIKDCVAYSNYASGINGFKLVDMTFTGSYLTAIGAGGGASSQQFYVTSQNDTVDYVISQDSIAGGVNEGSNFDYIMLYNHTGSDYGGTAPTNYTNATDPDLTGSGGNILQYGVLEADRPKVGGFSVGAQIQYRYVDGVLTADELWPWPMNYRIAAAMADSGYDSDGGVDGADGTDLTKTIFELDGGTNPFATSAPYVSERSPASGETSTGIADISVHVISHLYGVDISTIELTEEGNLHCCSGETCAGGTADLTCSGSPADYTVTLGSRNYDYLQEVNITVDADDLAASPNSMDQVSYSYTVESEPGAISIDVSVGSGQIDAVVGSGQYTIR